MQAKRKGVGGEGLGRLLITKVVDTTVVASNVDIRTTSFDSSASAMRRRSINSTRRRTPRMRSKSRFRSSTTRTSSTMTIDSTGFPSTGFHRCILSGVSASGSGGLSTTRVGTAGAVSISKLKVSGLGNVRHFACTASLFTTGGGLASMGVAGGAGITCLGLDGGDLTKALSLDGYAGLHMIGCKDGGLAGMMVPSGGCLGGLSFMSTDSGGFAARTGTKLGVKSASCMGDLSRIGTSGGTVASFGYTKFRKVLSLEGGGVAGLGLRGDGRKSRMISLCLSKGSLDGAPSVSFAPR